MKYHNFTTRWERTNSRGTRYYYRNFNTEAEAVAFAREKDARGALFVRVYEAEGDTDAPFTDEHGVHHEHGCHRSRVLRYNIPWWEKE